MYEYTCIHTTLCLSICLLMYNGLETAINKRLLELVYIYIYVSINVCFYVSCVFSFCIHNYTCIISSSTLISLSIWCAQKLEHSPRTSSQCSNFQAHTCTNTYLSFWATQEATIWVPDGLPALANARGERHLVPCCQVPPILGPQKISSIIYVFLHIQVIYYK